MTKSAPKSAKKSQESILPFDIESLTQGIRVKPAVFARMCQVSKQAVSQWIQLGKITLYPDGTLDPHKAAQQVIDNSDPGRMRAKVFKLATDEAAMNKEKIIDLEEEIAGLNAQLEDARLRIDYLDGLVDEIGEAEYLLHGILLDAMPRLKECAIDQLPELIDELFDTASLQAGALLSEERGEGNTL